MADIFFSYAKEDRSRIRPLVKALEKQGWSVFWDRTIPAGKTWRQVLGKALDDARSIIVAWSEVSIKSHWVIEEADQGREAGILIPILIANVKPPLGFRSIQAADLINCELSSQQFKKLISDLESILGPSKKQAQEVEDKISIRELAEELRLSFEVEPKLKTIIEILKKYKGADATTFAFNTDLDFSIIFKLLGKLVNKRYAEESPPRTGSELKRYTLTVKGEQIIVE